MLKTLGGLATSAVLAVACAAVSPAFASSPLPGDAVPPPVGINIFLYYNEFTNAGAIGALHGPTYDHNTRIAADIQALRYIHTFELGGMEAGVQMTQAYSSFLGGQEMGLPAVGPFGPGRARLAHGGGFAQPQLSAFIFAYANPATGTYLVLSPWIAPPIGSYDKNATLNYTQNLWTVEGEAGFHTTLLGRPEGQNLGLELWGEVYVYGDNNDAAAVSPAVYANQYLTAGPVQPAFALPARLHEQPSEEFRVFLPWQFYPATRATIIPGYYQAFGGKQVDRLANGATVDTGRRTNESQLFLGVSTYLSPHWQVMVNGQYDLAAHGAALNRAVELRVATAF